MNTVICMVGRVLTVLAVLLGGVSSASADWERNEGFYLTLHGGALFPTDTESRFRSPGLPSGFGTIDTHGNTGYRFGGAVGYRFPWILRLEAEVSRGRSTLDSAVVNSFFLRDVTVNASGRVTTLSGMFNLYLDAPVDWWVQPYVGAGIGVVRLSAQDNRLAGNPFPLNDRETVFGFQVMAGGTVELMDSVELALQYRYMNVDGMTLYNARGDAQFIPNTHSHSVELVLRVYFSIFDN